MFGDVAENFVVILIIGALEIGPSKLPEYAAKLGRLVRELRRMANTTREQLREILGPEFEDVDWRKLDPRQYDRAGSSVTPSARMIERRWSCRSTNRTRQRRKLP